jgi:type IV pilus assembly protein PilC
MKIKAFSWIVAGAYLLCGVMLFIVIPQFESIFSGFAAPLPLLTRTVFAIGPFGWLSLAVTLGALVILKEWRFRSRLLDLIFVMLFMLLAGCITVALFLPFIPVDMSAP